MIPPDALPIATLADKSGSKSTSANVADAVVNVAVAAAAAAFEAWI